MAILLFNKKTVTFKWVNIHEHNEKTDYYASDEHNRLKAISMLYGLHIIQTAALYMNCVMSTALWAKLVFLHFEWFISLKKFKSQLYS